MLCQWESTRALGTLREHRSNPVVQFAIVGTFVSSQNVSRRSGSSKFDAYHLKDLLTQGNGFKYHNQSQSDKDIERECIIEEQDREG